MAPIPPFPPNEKFPSDQDPRRWLTDDEVRMFDAVSCRDLTHHIDAGVFLVEDQLPSGRPKAPRHQIAVEARTAEQQARATYAQGLLDARAAALYSRNLRTLFRSLARERALRAGWEPAEIPAGVGPNTPPDVPDTTWNIDKADGTGPSGITLGVGAPVVEVLNETPKAKDGIECCNCFTVVQVKHEVGTKLKCPACEEHMQCHVCGTDEPTRHWLKAPSVNTRGLYCSDECVGRAAQAG